MVFSLIRSAEYQAQHSFPAMPRVRSSIENVFIKSFSSFGLIKFENGDGEKFNPA